MRPATALLLLLVASGAAAGDSAHVTATRLPRAPVLDGAIDPDEWRGAALLSEFRQKYPRDGAAPADPTHVRLAFTSDTLWIAIDCPQTVPVVARLARRDRLNESDRVHVSIGARGDRRTAFEFSVNPAGQLVDRLYFNDTESNLDWDEVWDARAKIRDGGWSVELRIPLRALRYDPKEGFDWDLQVRRYTSLRQETDEWAYFSRTVGGEVSQYGKLSPPRGLRRPGRFQLRPYVLGFLRHRDAGSAAATRSLWDGGGNVGLDAKLHLTSALVLDLAINPDFAQVEADQVILNLSNFEFQFPEKRPFFLEGVDTFATPFQLLYTRRIGLAPPPPALRSDAPYQEALATLPGAARILVATKLQGTITRRLAVGLLAALVDRTTVRIDSPTFGQSDRLVEPLRLFGALRAKLFLPRNLEIGALLTTAVRFEPHGRYPLAPNGTPTYALCPSGTFVAPDARCFHDSLVGALDARWRSPSGDYVLRVQGVTSARLGGTVRQLRDGTQLGPGAVGGGAFVELLKSGGKHWLFLAKYQYASPKLDYNDLGFMARQNFHSADGQLTYRTTTPWRFALESEVAVRMNEVHSERGLLLDRHAHLTAWFRSHGFVGYFLGLFFRDRRFDDREVGDGTALQRERAYGVEAEVDSDARRGVWAVGYASIEGRPNGWSMYAEGTLAVRAISWLDLELKPEISWSTGEPRYAGRGAASRQPIFQRLDALGTGLTLRATVTVTPRLSLQAYAQLFVAKRSYGAAYRFDQPRGTIGPVVRLAALDPTSETPTRDPSGQDAALNLNLVLRWEYRLGSVLYIAYTRSQTPARDVLPGERPRLDPGALRSAPAVDVLFLKLSYFFG